jgi:hypothetical protein
MCERYFALVDGSRHRRGALRVRRRGKRDVALAGEKPRCRIESNPTGAGKIDLGPGVKVGEVDVGAARPIEPLDVRIELNEIARDKARGQTKPAKGLDEQPGAVATRAGTEGQCLFRRLDARLEPDDLLHRA